MDLVESLEIDSLVVIQLSFFMRRLPCRIRFGWQQQRLLLLSRVYEQKAAAGDTNAIKILQSTSPVAWRNIHLIGNFDFTAGSSEVDIEALAARYQDEDFWRRSMSEAEDESPSV